MKKHVSNTNDHRTDKHLQWWGSATYNRVETEREIPKLKLIWCT